MIRRHLHILVSLVLGIAAQSAHARVFNFNDMGVAAYFRATGAYGNLGQDAFKHSSGDQTIFQTKDSPVYNYSGEIGVAISMGDRLAARLGIEGFQSRQIEAPGFSSLGTHLMTVDSKVAAVIPSLTFEIIMTKGDITRSYFFAGAGYANIRATNTYTMTVDGTALYGGVQDYKEAVESTAIMSHYGVGFEFLFSKNATMALEAGYRTLSSGRMTHRDSVTTVNGAISSGATAEKNNGSSRSLDLGGPFAGLTLRFYIPAFR